MTHEQPYRASVGPGTPDSLAASPAAMGPSVAAMGHPDSQRDSPVALGLQTEPPAAVGPPTAGWSLPRPRDSDSSGIPNGRPEPPGAVGPPSAARAGEARGSAGPVFVEHETPDRGGARGWAQGSGRGGGRFPCSRGGGRGAGRPFAPGQGVGERRDRGGREKRGGQGGHGSLAVLSPCLPPCLPLCLHPSVSPSSSSPKPDTLWGRSGLSPGGGNGLSPAGHAGPARAPRPVRTPCAPRCRRCRRLLRSQRGGGAVKCFID
ncbi:translation initiation factor IF-2-like [Cuculus canorus]|uniref:translation initiation factor IF-2-like n=1 Tax=Cuculus canorus TaxID=55661 RepID=UPI0023AA2E5F|nr:translation initiation factor IF-2-like [Cuculus canorus]